MDHDRPRRPRRWGSWGYIVLIVIALLLAALVVRPVGIQVTGVFQRLTDAFKYGK